jgi:hypothetical protein
MATCPLGDVQLRWQTGHPLNDLLHGHDVFAATAVGDSLIGVLAVQAPWRVGVVGAMTLADDDVIYHARDHCSLRAAVDVPELQNPAAPVTFWLARLHHRQLHAAEVGRPTGISCPTCRLAYFALGQPDHSTVMHAAAILIRECPDHRGSFLA